MLHPSIRAKYKEAKYSPDEWKYTDRETGKLYRVYTLQDSKV
jgi:hypothetical protein